MGIQHSGILVAHLLCGKHRLSAFGETIGAIGMAENIARRFLPIHFLGITPIVFAKVDRQEKAGSLAARQQPSKRLAGMSSMRPSSALVISAGGRFAAA
jgi:hypothetical protein